MADNTESVRMGYRGKLGDWRRISVNWTTGICSCPLSLDCGAQLTLDYERSAETAEAMVYIASIYLMYHF